MVCGDVIFKFGKLRTIDRLVRLLVLMVHIWRPMFPKPLNTNQFYEMNIRIQCSPGSDWNDGVSCYKPYQAWVCICLGMLPWTVLTTSFHLFFIDMSKPNLKKTTMIKKHPDKNSLCFVGGTAWHDARLLVFPWWSCFGGIPPSQTYTQKIPLVNSAQHRCLVTSYPYTLNVPQETFVIVTRTGFARI